MPRFTFKDIAKWVGPYITAIGMVIGVYADGQTKIAMMDYRIEQVEKDKDVLRNDISAIKDLLYSINTKLTIFGTQLEERTGR